MSLLTLSNPYALLDDDVPTVVVKKVVAAPAPAIAPKAAAPRTQNAGRGAPRKVYQGDREVNADGPAAGETAKEDRSNGYAGRGGARGGRGRGAGRGGANPRSNGGTYLGGDRPRRENGGGRPFDKHSQTGHKDSEKSEAQGWGADEGKKELEAEVLGESDAKTEAAPADGSAPVAAKEEKVYPVQEEEEEDNTQTYDEYLAAQAEKKLNIALPEARVANEGVDEAQWEGQTLVAKKGANEDEWFTGAAKAAAKAKKTKEGKTYLEINARFPPPRRDGPTRGGAEGGRGRGGARGRGERGARGGARGGAPRGAPRASAPAMDLTSATAFPTLA